MLKSNHSPNVPFLLLFKNGSLPCGLITLAWAEMRYFRENMEIQLYSTIIISLVGLCNPFALSAVCHLNVECLGVPDGWKLRRYLLPFKLLGFEWVPYEKIVPMKKLNLQFLFLSLKKHNSKQNPQQNWKHVSNVRIYWWDKTEAPKYSHFRRSFKVKNCTKALALNSVM